MKTSTIIISLLAVAAVGTGIYVYNNRKKEEETSGANGANDGWSNFKDGDKIGNDCYNKAANAWGADYCKKSGAAVSVPKKWRNAPSVASAGMTALPNRNSIINF